MPRGKAKKSVSLPARKGRAKKTTAGAAATTQSSSIPKSTSTRPKRVNFFGTTFNLEIFLKSIFLSDNQAQLVNIEAFVSCDKGHSSLLF